MGLVIIRNGEEIGQLLDYSIDLAYGNDENDYRIETIEPKMELGDMWIVEDSDYGGIVDEVQSSSTTPIIKYNGRSLQGILATFNALQIASSDVFTILDSTIRVNGTTSDIADDLMEQLSLPFTLIGDETEVDMEVDRFIDLYSFMRTLLEENMLKLKFGYTKEDGFFAEITNAIDFSKEQGVDASVFATSIKQGAYIPNHFIGVCKTDEKTYIKHFFTNDQHEFDGFFYLDTNHQAPLYDEEYERFASEQQIFGKDEIVEVIEANSTVKNYDVVTKKGVSPYGIPYGNTEFKNGVPINWDKEYVNYYYRTTDDDGNEIFKHFEPEEEFVRYTPQDESMWANHWHEYFKKVGDSYVQLSSDDVTTTEVYYMPPNPSKADWERNFANYYTRRIVDNVPVYTAVQGEPKYDYHKQTKEPSDWDEEKGSYYRQWERFCWDAYAEIRKNGKWAPVGNSQRIMDSLKNGSPDGEHTFAYYFDSNSNKTQKKKIGSTRWTLSKKKTYFDRKVTLDYYCEQTGTILKSIKFEKNKYFLRVEVGKKAPKWVENTFYLMRKQTTGYPSISGTYYAKGDFIPEPYKQGDIFKPVEDHYSAMVQKVQETLEKYVDNSQNFNATFSPIDGEYDIGDVISSTHPITQNVLYCKIVKKIVKITPLKTEVSYSVV